MRLANLGSGPAGGWLPPLFHGWDEFRVDSDRRTVPDLCADILDLSAIEDASFDAAWLSHTLEHVYQHQVPWVLAGVHRILNDDGFLVIVVPDLQVLAGHLHHDQLHGNVYISDAGAITAHDIIYGHGPSIARGIEGMAHRCGFSKSLLGEFLERSPFADSAMQRWRGIHLVAVAFKSPSTQAQRAEVLSSIITPPQAKD